MFKNIVKRILRKMSIKELPERINIRDDEFFKWLSFAVPGMTGGGNIESIFYAIKHLPSNSPIVEIGSFCGLSTIIISHFKARFGKTNNLYTCDRWKFEGQKLGSSLGQSKLVNHDQYKKFVKESYIRNIKTFCAEDIPHTIEVFSDDFFNMWSSKQKPTDVFGKEAPLGGLISFAFIDGNHTYEFVKRDFLNIDKYLERGGFILFDDSSDYSHWQGSNKVMKEILKRSDYELVARNPNYLFRKS